MSRLERVLSAVLLDKIADLRMRGLEEENPRVARGLFTESDRFAGLLEQINTPVEDWYD